MLSSKNQEAIVSKKNKLSFVSAILIVIGSSIGAGIFLKNDEILKNTQGMIYLAIIAWAIAIFAIVCLGLCLTELCSTSTKNKLGIIGWIKTFCNNYLYQIGKKFMAYIYLPINFFVMPYYSICTIQQAFPNSGFTKLDWYYVALIALLISSWFILTSGMSTRATNIQNKIITCVKFLPLIFAILIGYIYVGDTHHINEYTPVETKTPLFNELSPVLGIFISIPSIFFVFDGFYSTAGLQTEMNEPKKSAKAMLIGLLTVSCIDILISISLMISGKGSLEGLKEWFEEKNCYWLLQTMQLIVAIGIWGIINGFALYSTNYYEELIDKNEVIFSNKIRNKMTSNSHLVGCLYSYCMFFTMFLLCTLVGSLCYIDTNAYQASNIGLNVHVCKLYSFVDLMANWTSALVFGCIVISIIGALRNRKTNKIKTANDKNFVWAAYATTIIVCFSLLMILIETFVNLGLVCSYYSKGMYEGDAGNQNLVSAIMTVVVLFVFLVIMLSPYKHKKYN